MKPHIILCVLLASFLAVACDNSGSWDGASGANSVSDCKDAVDRAVRNAGPDESEMIRAKDKALEDCMAGK